MKYTEDMIEFLRTHYNKGEAWESICEMFRVKFGETKTTTNLRSVLGRHRPHTMSSSLRSNRARR